MVAMAINVKRIQAPHLAPSRGKRYGMLPGGVLRKRLAEEDLPDFWASERRERFPLVLRCRDGWASPLDCDEWLFGSSAVALIHAALPDLQILVDPAGAVTLKGLPQVNETWDIFDSGLKVNPQASDREIASFVIQAIFQELRGTVTFGVEALDFGDLQDLIEIIQTDEED